MTDWPTRNDRKKQWIMTIPFKQFYSAEEVSRILGICASGVYMKIKRGTLRGVQVEGVVMVRHPAILEYIRKRQKAEAPPGPGSRIVPIRPVPAKFTHDSSGRMPKATSDILALVDTEFGFLID